MKEESKWYEKRQRRSVVNLRLWPQNPRLSPDDDYRGTRDFAEEMLAEKSDRLDFYALADEIVARGFLSLDPIVVWQDQGNGKFYVAEGNRRVLVLKLLLNPSKAPKVMRKRFERLSGKINLESISKIRVAVAPSLDDAEWYISQRHSPTSNQKRWSREQQHRWVAKLYDKYGGKIEEIYQRISISQGDLHQIIATLELKNFVPELKGIVSDEVIRLASSIKKFPLSTFERLIHNPNVREHLSIKVEGKEIVLLGDRQKFLIAFGELLRRMLKPSTPEEKIDSRSTNNASDIAKVLETIPKVEKLEVGNDTTAGVGDENQEGKNESEGESDEGTTSKPPKPPKKPLKGDSNRNRLLLSSYMLETDRHRLSAIFDELKEIPTQKYPNSVAAAIRVFLDIAVNAYFQENPDFISEIQRLKKFQLKDVALKDRLEFMKQKLGRPSKGHAVIEKLVVPTNEFSLDVLNGYVHGSASHFIDKAFLNRFWDFLFPLFEDILDISEEN